MLARSMSKIEDLFATAWKLDPRQREAYMAEGCRDDDGLRAQVEARLAADFAGTTGFNIVSPAPGARLALTSWRRFWVTAALAWSSGPIAVPGHTRELAAESGAGTSGRISAPARTHVVLAVYSCILLRNDGSDSARGHGALKECMLREQGDATPPCDRVRRPPWCFARDVFCNDRVRHVARTAAEVAACP